MTDGDEPLFCTLCGAIDWECGHDPHLGPLSESFPGPYCETCGVIPVIRCGRNRPTCITKEEMNTMITWQVYQSTPFAKVGTIETNSAPTSDDVVDALISKEFLSPPAHGRVQAEFGLATIRVVDLDGTILYRLVKEMRRVDIIP